MNKASTSMSALVTNQSTLVCRAGSGLCGALIGFAVYEAVFKAMDMLIPRAQDIDCYAELSSDKIRFRAMFTDFCMKAAQTMATVPLDLVGKDLADRISHTVHKMEELDS